MTMWVLTAEDRAEIAARSVALGFAGTPDAASHALGTIVRGGECLAVHTVHAVDAVITDGRFVVLINRKNPPSQGMPALPGGFLDPVAGGTETAIQGAAREAMEEAGIVLCGGVLIGRRNLNRPTDVRIAWNDLPAYGIKQGEAFLVTTQAVRFDVPDLTTTNLTAGDDALPGSARIVALAALTPDFLGIRDHYDMIAEAVAGRI